MPVLLAAFLAHPTTLFALANLKHDLGKLWAWLCHRSFWQIMFGAALILAGWEYIGKRAEQRHATKVETQLSKTTAELKRLANESKAQQQQVTKTVDHYITVTKPVIEKEVRTIEAAPLPGNCKTPKEVLDADV